MMEANQERPWTVYVLVALFVVGAVIGMIFDDEWNLWDAVGLLFSAGIIYLLWLGKRWVYTLMFILFALCLVGVGLSIGVRLVASDGSVGLTSWLGVVNLSVVVALLVHPATKRFAGNESERAHPQVTPS